MKINKWFGYACILAAGLTMAVSCDDKNDTPETPEYVWSNDGGLNAVDHILFNNGAEDAEGHDLGLSKYQELVFTGDQTIKKGTYNLYGWIYIMNGAKLTIEPGTVIKGDKNTKAALIVEPGGQLIAKGTKEEPIVFTSAQAKGQRRPGDWGGVILCGNAPVNEQNKQIEGGPRTKFGGNNAADNSGVLSYVRIEFAGYPFEKDKEINGLTFGGVGSGTQIDHVQVSYSNDDSFEWFGGSVNAKYLVAYHGWDDDFDTDNGFSGKVQFGLSVRDSRIADASQSNGFESDNNGGGSTASPYTTAVFSNMTFVGPKVDPSFVNDNSYITAGDLFPNNGSALGRFQSAMQIRRSSKLSCFNSVAVGWPIGLIIDGEKKDDNGGTPAYALNGEMKFQNNIFAFMDAVGTDGNKMYQDVLYDAKSKTVLDENKISFSHQFFNDQTGDKYYETLAEMKLSDNGYMPQAGSPVLGAASFADGKVSSGFDKVDYVGAFNVGDNWLDGWTEFNPENANY